MALTLVQTKSFFSNNADATPRTMTLNSTPVQGNVLILVAAGDQLMPDAQTGWTVIGGSADFSNVKMWFKIAGASESTTVSVSYSAASNGALWCAEYSGLDTTGGTPVDKLASAIGQGSGNTIASGTTATTTQANELLIAAVAIYNTTTFNITAWSNGFTEVLDSTTTGGTVNDSLSIATNTVAATGAYSTVATVSTGALPSNNNVGIIATFKIAPELRKLTGIATLTGITTLTL